MSNINGGLDYRWSLDGRTGFDVDKDRWLSDALLALNVMANNVLCCVAIAAGVALRYRTR